MEMEVVVPVKAMDFEFNRARSSQYLSTPSPKRFGEYYFSAPSSPERLSGRFYQDLDDFSVISSKTSSSAAVAFDWEEEPGRPKSSKPNMMIKYEDDFAFDVSEELESTYLSSAEELFDGGKIRPLKPPPQTLLQGNRVDDESATQKSPVRSRSKKIIKEVFSPRQKKGFFPFVTAAENTCKRTEHERGRERSSVSSSPSSSHRGTRSLSPFRVSKYPWEEQEQEQQQLHNTKQSSIIPKPTLSSTTSSLSSSSSKGNRKWRLKDFCLFRNASEGRAMDRYPLKKYAALFKKHEDIKNASFRSLEGSNSGSSSNRRGPVSAHELHYTVNRAVSEDLKKKTFLPYKQGILGRLAFNPTVHALANSFGFSRG